MANLGFNIRWADNTQELSRHLKDGLNQIEATGDAVNRLTKRIGGDDIIRASHNYAAALQKIGGEAGALAAIEKLTAQERTRGISTLDAAIQKYKLLGREAPSALGDILTQMRKLEAESAKLPEQIGLGVKAANFFKGSFGSVFAGFTAAGIVSNVVGGLKSIASEALSSAGHLVDLSDKTGLSIESLQRMDYVAGQTGASLDDFTTSAFKLGIKLAGSSGHDSVSSAVDTLGLSFQALRSQKPDQQFEAIVDALGKIEDPQERNRLAVELFGKTAAQILPAIAAGYRDIAKNAHVAGDAQVRAADGVGDAYDNLVKGIKAGFVTTLGTAALLGERPGLLLKGLLGGINLDALAQFNAQLDRIANKKPADINLPVAKGDASYVEMLKAAREAASKLTAEQRKQITAAEALGISDNELADKYGALALQGLKAEAASKKLSTAQRDAVKDAEAIQAMQDRLTGSDAKRKLDQLVVSWHGLTDAQRANQGDVDRLLKEYEPLRQIVSPGELPSDIEALAVAHDHTTVESKRLNDAVHELEHGLKDLNVVSLAGFINMRKMADEAAATRKHIDTIELTPEEPFKGASRISGPVPGLPLLKPEQFVGPMKNTFGMAVTATLKDLPQVVQSAIQGGGNPYRAIGSTLGAKLGDNVATSLNASIAKRFTTTDELGKTVTSGFGKILGTATSFIPLVGSLLGPAISGLGKLFGIGRSEADKTKKAIADWGKELTKSGSSIDQVRAKAVLAGYDFDKLLNTRKVKDFQSELDKLDKALQFQSDTMATLDEAVKRYGFSLEELGPALQRQNLDQQAQQFYKDFKFLTAAGVDATVVLRHMAGVIDEVGEDGVHHFKALDDGLVKFFQNARKFGIEIPLAMQPMLQGLIDQGLLIDDNGNKVTDLKDAGVTFSLTMSQGFQLVASKLDALIEAIGRSLGLLPPLVRNTVTDINTELNGLHPPPGVKTGAGGTDPGLPPGETGNPGMATGGEDIPAHVALGGRVTMRGVQRFGLGGKVLRWPSMGTDTVPAMLTPGELVLNANQQNAVAALMEAGQGFTPPALLSGDDLRGRGERRPAPAPINVALTVQAWDGHDVMRVVKSHEFIQAFADVVLQDKRGIRRVIRRAAS